MVASLIYLLLIALSIQFAFLLGWLSRVFSLPPSPEPTDSSSGREAPPLSVIVCAHNEEENLKNNLPGILGQIYRKLDGRPNFELIVVNDRSGDGTDELLKSLSRDHPELRTISLSADLPRRFPGKKDALAHGLRAALHEWVLLTDADCYPRTAFWMQSMAARAGEFSVICGPGLYEHRPGWLNRMIQGETLNSYMMAYCLAQGGFPYLALGRNLLCRRDLLLAVEDHPLWSKTPSGDDDLFLRLQPRSLPLLYRTDRDSQTLSRPPTRFRDWLAQKQRHLSTGKYYRWVPQFLLGIYALSQGLGWLAFWVLVFLGWGGMALALQALRLLALGVIQQRWEKALDWKTSLGTSWFFDLCWPLYHLMLSPYIFWKNQRQWKRSSAPSRS